MYKKYSIIGTSAAGIAAARTLRNLDKNVQIICYSDEPEQPYNKCFLADYLKKDKSDLEITTLTPEQAKVLNITLCLGVAVTHIASDNRTVMLSNGKEEPYDALLIATGTRPRMPHIEGIDVFENVFAFHGFADAYALHTYIEQKKPQQAVIIGAGLSGLEVADALLARNIRITLVESDNQLLKRHVPIAGSAIIEGILSAQDGCIYKEKTVTKICGEKGCAKGIVLACGTFIPTDLVIVTVGVRQNNELAQQSGIVLRPEGIVVDEYLHTSQPDIYAAGDVIAVCDTISEKIMPSCTWPDAMQQGMHAAHAMIGSPKKYPGAAIIASSAFFGLKFYSCGPEQIEDSDQLLIEQSGDNYYHKYLISQGLLKGFCLVGRTQYYSRLRRALLLKEPFSL